MNSTCSWLYDKALNLRSLQKRLYVLVYNEIKYYSGNPTSLSFRVEFFNYSDVNQILLGAVLYYAANYLKKRRTKGEEK